MGISQIGSYPSEFGYPIPMSNVPKESITGVPWEDLAVLLAALRHGSLSEASRHLGIGQSTASRRLSRLEERLGARLFERCTEGLKPTSFALQLQGLATSIEGHMADVERLAAGQELGPRGRVTIAAPDGLASHWLLPALPRFYSAYPDVDIDILIGHNVVDLTRGEADLALRFIRPTSPDLVVRHLRKIPIGAYIHPNLAGTPPSELRWILLGHRESPFPGSLWVHETVRPKRTMNVSLWHALVSAIQNGLGAGLISPVIAEPLGLVPVFDHIPDALSHDLFLVYHRALRDVPRVSVCRRWLVDCAERLSGPLITPA